MSASRPLTSLLLSPRQAKCNGKNPCSRCSSKSLTCSYDQGSDGRRGRSSPTEVQALADKVQQYQRLFEILRTSPPNAACQILHHLRSQKDDITDGSDPATDTNLAKVLQYAETLASRSPSPDASNIPPPLARAWRQTASVPSETTSQEASSENGSQRHQRRQQSQQAPATLTPPAAWSASNNTAFDPQFATISDDFTMFGFNGSNVQPESSLPSDNEHCHTNTSDGIAGNVAANMPPAAAATSPGNNPPARWHPQTSTNFEQAHAWLRQDMDQIDRYLGSNLGRKKI
ncbi:hypothetical protein H2204_010321 [Knufia peltigerae]|uniref:Zn(2)-C6 fungal-type domain-containing protein n=1 Tax=Knufia peltigerae TaxID=1002370 RepID=A0AA39CU69_9EURO|nr:hypothetical protein H2204_010321 [Knufia peltigerae]